MDSFLWSSPTSETDVPLGLRRPRVVAVAVLLALAGTLGFTFLAYSRGQGDAEAGFKGPEDPRGEDLARCSPTTTLPAGYYAGGAMSIPFLMDFAFFTDKEPARQEWGRTRGTTRSAASSS